MDIETALPAGNEGTPIPGEERPASSTPVETTTSGADDVESRARAQGWVPREEFRGDPDKWRDAGEFVKRGEELLPVALERSRAAERKAQELEQRLQAQAAEAADKLERLERMSVAALQRHKQQLEANYQHAMRAAVETGDVARYDQLSRDLVTARDQFDQQVSQQVNEAPQPDGYRPLPPQIKATVDTWVQSNEWFNRDPELNAVAQAHHSKLLREKPGLSLSDNLAETTKYVRQRYPERFGQTQQFTTPMVEAGGGRVPSSAGPRAKGANDLPADVRAVGQRYVTQGLFKDLNEYAREYFSQD